MPWRKICAGLPAVALIGGGVALTALAGPDSKSAHSPAIVVPDVALAVPATRAQIPADPSAVPQPETPGLVLPAGVKPGSSTPLTLDSKGIPLRALKAYRNAASMTDSADPGCRIDWALPAAVGRVESDHARFAGNHLDSDGVARPGIIGISLDGSNGTARITDSDGGRLDQDRVYDRAVGPMQFIPSTWRLAGTDADGDKVKNPQDMADSATAAAIYLCSGPGDLSQPDDLRAAVMRYNASDSYARTVTAIAAAYRHGVTALPASDLPSAGSPGSTSIAAPTVTNHRRATPSKPAANQSGSVPANASQQRPPDTASAPASPGSTPDPAAPDPATPDPATPDPATPDPATPGPATPDPAKPDPKTPDPAKPDPKTPDPAKPDPKTPDRAKPDPKTPDPAKPDPKTPDHILCTPAVADPTVSPTVPDPSVNPTVPGPAGTVSTPLIPCVPTTNLPPTSSPVSASRPQALPRCCGR